MAQPAADFVPHDSRTNRLPHDEAGTGNRSGRFLLRRATQVRTKQVNNDATATGPATGAYSGGEVGPSPQALPDREHVSSSVADGYAEMRARPLARRAETMARPALVRMRSRKPWVFARRRLFGW